MKKSRILSMLLCSALIFSNISTLNVKAYESTYYTDSKPNSNYVIKAEKNQIRYQDFGNELNNKLKTLIEDMDKLKSEKNVLKPLNKDIKSIFKITDEFLILQDTLTVDQLNAHFENDQFDYIFYNLIYLAYYNSPNAKERNDYYIYLSDNMFKHTAKNHNNNIPYFYHRFYDYFLYVTANEIKEIDLPVRNAKNMIIDAKPIQTPEGSKPSKIDDTIIPSKVKPINPEAPVQKPDDTNNGVDIPDIEIKPNEPPATIGNGNYKTSYVAQGNVCYKLTEYFDSNNVATYKDMKEVPKEEYKYCGIFDYVDIFNFEGVTAIDSNIWGDFAFTDNLKETIFFTINKNSEKPYYYNTNISFDREGNLTYDKLSKVLNSISSKTNGYFVKDSNKFLSVVTGNPIVINGDENKTFTKDFVSSIFKDFKEVGILISDPETVTNAKENNDSITYNDVKQININGKKNSIKPIFKSDKVLFPAKELFDSLNIDYSRASNDVLANIVVDKDIISVKDDYIYVNGKVTDVNCYTETIDGVQYVELKNIIELLKYKIDYSKSSGILSIEKIKE